MFFKKQVFHICVLPYSYVTKVSLVGVVASESPLVFSGKFFGIELSFFLKVQRSRFERIACFL